MRFASAGRTTTSGWFLVLVSSILVLGSFAGGSQGFDLVIDLDRSTPAIDSAINAANDSVVQGAVVLQGISTDTAGAYSLAVEVKNLTDAGNVDPLGTTCTIAVGDLPDNPDPLTVATACGDPFINSEFFSRTSSQATATQLGADGIARIFLFDTTVKGANGNQLQFSIIPTQFSAAFGIVVNGEARTIAPPASESNIATSPSIVTIGSPVGPTETPTPTNTPTNTPIMVSPCSDSGYYILDSFGGRHRVGNALSIIGSLYYGRPNIAVDMENVKSGSTQDVDLAVLDRFGATQFVKNPASVPSQTWYFPEGSTPARGFAVDVEFTDDFTGLWVLTEAGGIYRGGSAKPGAQDALLGNDAANLVSVLNIPFGGANPRDPNLPAADGSKIRAVALVVVQSGNNQAPTGFVVLDSQGGHYIFDGAGNNFDHDVVGSILNSDAGSSVTVYPFFKGLDIARDMELHPDGTFSAGLAILDGWGGIHPVPVDNVIGSKVYFLTNQPPAPVTAVGMPYLPVSLPDDPTTAADESNGSVVGKDTASIFLDLEFCSFRGNGGGGDGIYTLDAWGGVFAFGNTRLNDTVSAPKFTGGPYFFPARYARDLEPETAFETDFETDFVK